MTSEQFEYLRAFLKKQSGLVLAEDKRYLIDSRLSPVAREFGLSSISTVVEALRRPGSARLAERVTEAMTINESFFFRDIKPFENFRNIVLPHLLQNRTGTRKFRIWSAAASTGQEAYSLAIELKEQRAKMAGWRIDIVGTDICNDALSRARAGVYSQFEVQRGMPTSLLMKYFKQTGPDWQISDEIKSMVDFRYFNLMNDFRSLGTFDVVFCRNVLIYFDRDTKINILNRLSKMMPEDGFLVLGAAETIVGLSREYQMVDGAYGLYRRLPQSTAASPSSAAGGGHDWSASVQPASASRSAAKLGAAGGSLFAAGRGLSGLGSRS